MLNRFEILELSRSLPPAERERVDVGTLVEVATDAIARREWQHAGKILHGALLVDPDHAGAWSVLGELEREQGNDAAATEAYATALMLDDRDPSVALALVELHLSAERRPQAQALLDWLLLNADPLPERALVLAAELGEEAP